MTDSTPATAATELVRKVGRVVGYVPVGTTDLLNVLAHPDVIEDTRRWLADVGANRD